jgi:protein-disulfide isomerase
MKRPLVSIFTGILLLASPAPACRADSTFECRGENGSCPTEERNHADAAEKAEFARMLLDYFEEHRAEVDALLYKSLQRNPNAVIDAMQSYQRQKAGERLERTRQAIADNGEAIFSDGSDPTIGNPRGDVTIVEWFDNQCPYCKRFAPVLQQLILEDAGIRVVLKEYPILGPGSELAAKYALASMRQGKYAVFHQALMADQTPEHQLDEQKIKVIAGASGLDVDQLVQDAMQPSLAVRIAANRILAQKLSITGTPGLIVGGQFYGGSMSPDALRQAVNQARSHKS